MECSEERQNEIIILGLRGRMDAVTSPLVEQRLVALLETGARHVVVDCAQLAYISSAGLRVFLMAAKRITQVKGKITLTALNEEVQQVFDLTGFSTILHICPSREEALAR